MAAAVLAPHTLHALVGGCDALEPQPLLPVAVVVEVQSWASNPPTSSSCGCGDGCVLSPHPLAPVVVVETVMSYTNSHGILGGGGGIPYYY